MSQGSRSWESVGFLVYGCTSLFPAKLEQQIVSALPYQETNIDSFESYEEALNFCKNTANVGLIFIHENCGKQKIETVFKQLAKPLKTSGWPVLGVVIKKDKDIDSIAALKAMNACDSIVGYYSESDFNQSEFILKLMDDLWFKYIEKVESNLIPDALRESLKSIVDSSGRAAENSFYQRITELISQPLNLTWKERFRIRWHYIVTEADRITPAVLNPHPALKKMSLGSNASDDELGRMSLLSIASSSDTLPIRVIEISRKILEATKKQNLDELLQEAKREARPGRPGLLRTVAAESDSIREIYSDCFLFIEERKVGT